MTKTPRSYTKLTPAQRLLLAQIVITFPEAKASAIAKMAGVSHATVYNATLRGGHFFIN